MFKSTWYYEIEEKLKEYRTLDIAIKNLEKKDDEQSLIRLSEKKELKETFEEIFRQLNDYEFEFVDNFYLKCKEPIEMESIMCISSATFYRLKKRVAMTIAKYYGLL